MRRRQFGQLTVNTLLLPLSASLVACGGGSSDSIGTNSMSASGSGMGGASALPNERIVLSTLGASYTLNKDEKILSPTASSGSATGVSVNLASKPAANPVDAAFDTAGNTYVLDRSLSEVSIYSAKGLLLRSFGSYGSAPGQFAYPAAIAVAGSRIYVADSGNNRIQVFSLDGMPLLQFGASNADGSGFNYPRDVEVNTGGEIYVLHSGKSSVTVHDAQGQQTGRLDISRNAQGKRQQVSSIALDPNGDLVYTETSQGTVSSVSKQGQLKNQQAAQTLAGRRVAALYIAQGPISTQPVLSGFVALS